MSWSQSTGIWSGAPAPAVDRPPFCHAVKGRFNHKQHHKAFDQVLATGGRDRRKSMEMAEQSPKTSVGGHCTPVTHRRRRLELQSLLSIRFLLVTSLAVPGDAAPNSRTTAYHRRSMDNPYMVQSRTQSVTMVARRASATDTKTAPRMASPALPRHVSPPPRRPVHMCADPDLLFLLPCCEYHHSTPALAPCFGYPALLQASSAPEQGSEDRLGPEPLRGIRAGRQRHSHPQGQP